jgi:prepilin-type N-terminal cleavage/methylation domain-containing protein
MSTGAKRQGFTLLEVVVALTITGAILSAVLGFATANLRVSRRTSEAAIAATLAESVLERQRLELWRLLATGSENGRFPPPFEEYTWHVTVQRIPLEDRLVGIQIQVAWTEGTFAIETRARRPLSAAAQQDSR